MLPWRDWYHCTSNTYGTWLPGDPRGFRTKGDRFHVDGDYKNPPARGMYEGMHVMARRRMKREAVVLTPEMQVVARAAVVEKLIEKDIELAAVAVDDHHLHVLGRFPDHRPRHWIGLAKKHSAFVVRKAGCWPGGGIWAQRGLCKPIVDEGHLRRAREYVLDHLQRGALVWKAGTRVGEG